MADTGPKRKCRQYNVEYLNYGFIPASHNEQLPFCLICEKTFSNEAMKPSRLIEHFKKAHFNKADKDVNYFRNLRDRRGKNKTVHDMFVAASSKNDDGLRASYNISLLIAQTGKAHTIGETLITPVIREVMTTVLKKDPEPVLKAISLSNNTIQRRIDEMASDVEENLNNILRNTEFSLQIDESTLPNNESLLLAYVRFIHDGKLYQELLFARTLETDTKGHSIFQTVEEFFKQKDIPIRNVVACATDGAASMIGRHRGFIAFLKKAVPNVVTIHCIIHRQHLVAKHLTPSLNVSLSIVITAVNKIKAHSLNSRLFRQLCSRNDEQFERLLLHTEVRWLSKGNCLARFFSLFTSVVEFLRSVDLSLAEQLTAIKPHVAYLADIFAIFNNLNLQLQGDEINLIKSKSAISGFISKLPFYRRNIGRKDFGQFPSLKELDECPSDDMLLLFSEHLTNIEADMKLRFKDLSDLEIPSWILDPFHIMDIDVDWSIEKELIDLRNDFELKPTFKQHAYQEFWLQSTISQKFPALWGKAKHFFIAFPTSYLVERGFSVVSQILSKSRNRLDIVERGDLRLRLTAMKPNIEELSAKHQIHPSH